MLTNEKQIEQQLKTVKSMMRDCLKDSSLSKLLSNNKNLLGSGKMLRSRLTLTIGNANNIEEQLLLHAAAAVDIIHGASLLHDDVIDGGVLRRGAPTFWEKYGISGAILLGDLLVFKALQLMGSANSPGLLRDLIEMSGEVCQSEVEQELMLRGTTGTWKECEKVARYKTGSLFAFAAMATATDAPGQKEALREAGFILGTAYQLADDVLDAMGSEEVSGKTLGTDHQRGKTTAITVTKNAPEDPVNYIYTLLDESGAKLDAWPELQEAWDSFLSMTMKPVLKKLLSS
ncbi:MAG TPA: polyprenyl synthetase family protein [Pontiella sp.]